MSCAICKCVGHNSATCTSPIIDEKATLLWELIENIEIFTRDFIHRHTSYPRNLILVEGRPFTKQIKRIVKAELRENFTSISIWKHAFNLFRFNLSVHGQGHFLTTLCSDEDLVYVSDFFRLSIENIQYADYRNVSQYVNLFYKLTLYVVKQRTRSLMMDDVSHAPPPLQQHVPPHDDANATLDFIDLAADDDRTLLSSPTLTELEISSVREVLLQIPEDNHSPNITSSLPRVPDAPRRPRRAQNRQSTSHNRRSDRRRTARFHSTNEDDILEQILEEDPHIERRRLMKNRVNYYMDTNDTKYQNEECGVCFDTLKHDNMIALQCGHAYCGDCLCNVIKMSAPSCPYCRADMKTLKFKQCISAENFNQLMASIASS